MAALPPSVRLPIDGQVEINGIDPHYNQLFVVAKYTATGDYTDSEDLACLSGEITVEGRIRGAGGWTPLSGVELDCTDPGSVVSTLYPLTDLRFTASNMTGTPIEAQISITAKAV